MHTLLLLITRELFLLALLTAIGATPAALVSDRVDAAARVALMPVFGLCIALCAMTTVTWRIPTDKCWWVLPLLALASAALAIRDHRRRRSQEPGVAAVARWRPSRGSVVGLVLVVVLVGAALDAPLVQSHSVGPVGYQVYDAAGYVIDQDGLRTESAHAAAAGNRVSRAVVPDLLQSTWEHYAAGYQEYSFDTVASGSEVILGLDGTQGYGPFLIVLIVLAALGVFAAVRVIGGGRSWPAVLAGVLVGGPFWIQLFMDGSEGAISGLALLVPLGLMAYLALDGRRARDWLLLALVCAGLQTAYPLFVPPIVPAAAIVLVVLAVRQRRAGCLDRRLLGRAALILIAVLLLAALLTPVAFARNVRYWHAVAAGHQSYDGLPVYLLPTGLLPSWLLQTRMFYYLPDSFGASFLPASILAPGVMLAVIALAFRRRPAVLAAGAVIVVACGLAYLTMSRYSCTYCVDRNLLVVSPLSTAIFGVGIAFLAASSQLQRRALAVGAALVALVAVGYQVRQAQKYITNGSYVFEPQAQAVIGRLPHLPARSVAIEGFSQEPRLRAPGALPFVYALVRYATGGIPSVPTESNDYSALAYLGGPLPQGPQFDPAYRFVLTRIAGVESGRQTLYRDGPVALQRRAATLDVLVTGGVATGEARIDPRGRAWLEPLNPLTMWVSGTHTGQRVWVDVEARATVPVSVVKAPGVTASRHGARLTVCAGVTGPGDLRRLGIAFAFTPVQQPIPAGLVYGLPSPPQGVQLLSVRAVTNSCAQRPAGIRPVIARPGVLARSVPSGRRARTSRNRA